jgi:FkbM family methyltransferase
MDNLLHELGNVLIHFDKTGILSFLALRFFIERDFEAWLQPFFKKEHGTVIDIGASQGIHTLQLASFAKKVIAVEPEKKNFCILKMRTKRYRNVIPVKMALGNRNTTSKLWVSKHPFFHSLVNGGGEFEEVSQTTLDRLLNDLSLTDVTLVKIDTEGAEHLILEGGEKTFTEQKPEIIIEYHDNKDSVIEYIQKYHYNWKIIKVGLGEHGWINASPQRTME